MKYRGNRQVVYGSRDLIVRRRNGTTMVELAPPVPVLPVLSPATELQKQEAERIREERRQEAEKQATARRKKWEDSQASRRA